MIIGVTGLCEDPQGNVRVAGAGKDTVADHLVAKHEFVRIGLADPLKRICAEIYGFTDAQLWGPSEQRNAADFRYPRGPQQFRDAYQRELQLAWGFDGVDESALQYHAKAARDYAAQGYLTPRLALQILGTEWGRFCYANTWIDYAVRVAKALEAGGHYYDMKMGLRPWVSSEMARAKTDVVFSDLRFYNEFKAVREAGGKVVRVRRKMAEVFSDTHLDSGHQSETELVTLADESFDYVLENYGTIDTLQLLVDRMMDTFKGKIRPYDEAQADVPPFMRDA